MKSMKQILQIICMFKSALVNTLSKTKQRPNKTSEPHQFYFSQRK